LLYFAPDRNVESKICVRVLFWKVYGKSTGGTNIYLRTFLKFDQKGRKATRKCIVIKYYH
jgi:hypothetical protein